MTPKGASRNRHSTESHTSNNQKAEKTHGTPQINPISGTCMCVLTGLMSANEGEAKGVRITQKSEQEYFEVFPGPAGSGEASGGPCLSLAKSSQSRASPRACPIIHHHHHHAIHVIFRWHEHGMSVASSYLIAHGPPQHTYTHACMTYNRYICVQHTAYHHQPQQRYSTDEDAEQEAATDTRQRHKHIRCKAQEQQ